VLEHLRALAAAGERHVVLAPIGFVSDHMEVVYDLDTDARRVAAELGLTLVRAATAGTHPALVATVREQVLAALAGPAGLRACAPDCCPAPRPEGRPGVLTSAPHAAAAAREGSDGGR
jgi:ferrochelatase